MKQSSVPRLRLNANRDCSTRHKNPTKLLTPSDFDIPCKTAAKQIPNRQSSKNHKNSGSKPKHCRRPSIDSYVPKNCQFTPLNNISMLKSMIKKSFDTECQRNNIEEKIKNSSLYKKLQLELQNLKKDYNKEVESLQNQIQQLNQQIDTQRQTVLNLIQKRLKMQRDATKCTDELVELQQKNYEMYWDVAARLNQQNQGYEDLVELQNVSRGLPKAQLENFLKNHQRKKGKKLAEEEQGCCICCHRMQESETICQLSCGHSHHSNCIKDWLSINKVCPLCRAEVKV